MKKRAILILLFMLCMPMTSGAGSLDCLWHMVACIQAMVNARGAAANNQNAAANPANPYGWGGEYDFGPSPRAS